MFEPNRRTVASLALAYFTKETFSHTQTHRERKSKKREREDEERERERKREREGEGEREFFISIFHQKNMTIARGVINIFSLQRRKSF